MGAIDDFTRALALDPEPAWMWKNRGLARAGRGDVPGAIEDLERFLTRAPQDPEAPAAQRKIDELEATRGH